MRPIQALVAGITLRQTNLTTVVTKLAYSIFLSLPPPPLLFVLFTRIFFRSTKDNLSLSSKLATFPSPSKHLQVAYVSRERGEEVGRILHTRGMYIRK